MTKTLKALLKLIYWLLLAKVNNIQIYDPFNSLKFDLEGFIEMLTIFNLNYNILLKYKEFSYNIKKGTKLNLGTTEEVMEKYDLILSILEFQDSNNKFFEELYQNKYTRLNKP